MRKIVYGFAQFLAYVTMPLVVGFGITFLSKPYLLGLLFFSLAVTVVIGLVPTQNRLLPLVQFFVWLGICTMIFYLGFQLFSEKSSVTVPDWVFTLSLTPLLVLLKAIFASIVVPSNPHSYFAIFDEHLWAALGHVLDALLATIRAWGHVFATCGLRERAQDIGDAREEGQGAVEVTGEKGQVVAAGVKDQDHSVTVVVEEGGLSGSSPPSYLSLPFSESGFFRSKTDLPPYSG